ncbi:MAG: STAS domain-containing protein [Planctomycetes bacterium]|nr:STAS domain-containing protein [Planctomycetota bacterium]
MRIEFTEHEDVTVLAITGELDVSTAPALQTRVRDLVENGRLKLIFDFGGLNHITSSGLSVLVFCVQLLNPKNGLVAIAGAKGLVKQVVEVWAGKKPSFVPSYPTVEDAIAKFAEES